MALKVVYGRREVKGQRLDWTENWFSLQVHEALVFFSIARRHLAASNLQARPTNLYQIERASQFA